MADLVYKTKEEVPEDLRDFVEEKDGSLIVKVSATKKVEEFRENNVKLAKDRDSLKTLLDKVKPIIGEDPEKFAADYSHLTELKKKVDSGELKVNEEIEKAIEKRVAEMKGQMQGQITALTKKTEELSRANGDIQGKYDKREVEIAIATAARDPKLGVVPSAIEDIVGRAHSVFKVKDGKVVPLNENGEVIYGSDGASPMSGAEWVNKLRDGSPHFFMGTHGGGAGGGNGGGVNGKVSLEVASQMPMEQYKALRQKGMVEGVSPLAAEKK